MSLKGKTALITGGSAGIGLATAVSLGKKGASIAICGRKQSRIDQAVRILEEEGVNVLSCLCDVSNLEQVENLIESVVVRYEGIDIVVNNAGALGEFPIEDSLDEVWARIMRTNLDGTYFVTSRAIPYMRDQGSIVIISGVLGKMGFPRWSAYSTSKHGLIGFTRALALELAPRKITVNAVCPGWVDTDLATSVLTRVATETGSSYEAVLGNTLSHVPLGRMITPQEIAALVDFLVSSAGRNITGQAYNICGGQVMH